MRLQGCKCIKLRWDWPSNRIRPWEHNVRRALPRPSSLICRRQNAVKKKEKVEKYKEKKSEKRNEDEKIKQREGDGKVQF